MTDWQMIHTDGGDWVWWKTLSNGWTAWVMDIVRHSERYGTSYLVCASAGGGPLTGGKYAQEPNYMKEFATAKYAAVTLALRQRPYIDRTYRLSTEL